MPNGKMKHAFLYCRKHNRVHYGAVWTKAEHFIKFFVENKLNRFESRFEEVGCDLCRKNGDKPP